MAATPVTEPPATTTPFAPAASQPQQQQQQEYTALPGQPSLSSADDGQNKRPRDARLLHLVLSSLGVHSYQERVPLQLLDFAYRYTSGVLSDSLRLAGEGYASNPGGTGKSGRGAGAGGGGTGGAAAQDVGDGGNITVSALRQAIASRMDGAFVTSLPKEWMLEQAEQRNRVMLPRIAKGFGLQLPPERYVLTGQPWGLLEEWDDDEDETDGGVKDAKVKAEDGAVNGTARAAQTTDGDETMGGTEEEEEAEGGTFEDVFGEDEGMQDS